jgi:hypothetical protein
MRQETMSKIYIESKSGEIERSERKAIAVRVNMHKKRHWQV